MLLTIDVGNSYITMGGWSGDKLSFVAELITSHEKSCDQYAVEFDNVTMLYGADIKKADGAVISSVVPELTPVIKGAVSKLLNRRPLVVGPGVKTGIHIAIDNPAQLGADLAACAVAAVAAGKLPCIIYDLGTTSTLSVIDSEGRYLGAVIAAGVGTTLEMFTSHTALLPHVSIEAPRTVIGRNSAHSVQSGLVYGTAAMLDGLAERIEEEIGQTAHIIATGGRAAQIAPYCRRKPEICEHLLLEGLKLIYERNRR